MTSQPKRNLCKSDWLHTNSKLVSIGALECNIRAKESCHNSFVAVTTNLEEKIEEVTEIVIAEGCQVL